MPTEKKIHVLHIIEAFGAGTLTAVSTLCSAVQGDFSHLVAYSIREETPDNFKELFPQGVQFKQIPMQREISLRKDFQAYQAIRKLIKESRPDIIHCHSSKAGVLGRIAAWVCGVPSVYTPHGYSFLQANLSSRKRSFFHIAEWLATRFGDSIAACGNEEYALAKRIGGNGYHVVLIKNSLAYETIAATKPYQWAGNLPVVGICGRLSPQRIPELFLELADRCKDIYTWVWIGAEKNDTHLPAYVQGTDWQTRDDALAMVAGLDVYLHISAWEGLSYSILEAMALGKPVVTTDIPPNRAVIQQNVTGFLGGSREEIEQYLRHLAAAPDLRKSIGHAAQKTIQAQHDSRVVYQAYGKLYRDVIDSF